MSKLILTLFLLAYFTTLNAQEQEQEEKKFTLGAGLRAGIPQRDLKSGSSFVIGLDVQG